MATCPVTVTVGAEFEEELLTLPKEQSKPCGLRGGWTEQGGSLDLAYHRIHPLQSRWQRFPEMSLRIQASASCCGDPCVRVEVVL